MCRVAAAGAWKEQPERQQLAWVAATTIDVGVRKAGAENRLTPLADVGELLGLPNRSLKISLREAPLGETAAVAPKRQTFAHLDNHV